MDEEKKYTVRSAEAELNKLRKVRDRNLEKIRELNAVVKENNESIKELEKIYDRLVSEQLQEEVRTRWFAGDRFSKPTIRKFLEISEHLNGRLENFDTELLVQKLDAFLDSLELDSVSGESNANGTQSENEEENDA